MKKWIHVLSLTLLLVLAVAFPASAEETNYLAPAPGSCWSFTNEGSGDVTVALGRLDYVVTDPDGLVTARDVSAAYPNVNPVIPAGGTAIVQNSGAFSGVITLNGDFFAVQLDAPAFLHEELAYGETCRFTNQTDHSANVLIRGEPSACVVYDSAGAITEKRLPAGSVGTNEVLLSVPAGGRAEVTPNGYYLYRENVTSQAGTALLLTMCRAENFSAERIESAPWTFGAVACNQPRAFRNITGEEQTIQTGFCPYAMYDQNGKLLSVTTGGAISVPAGYTVALGSSMLDGVKYACLTEAFEPSDLPGPITQFDNRNLKVTFRNTSGKAAPIYGVTQTMAERKPDIYDITGLVGPDETGKGVILPNGASLTVTGDQGADIFTIQGQFTVSAEGLPEAGKENAALLEGETCVLSNPGSEAVSVMLCGQSVSVLGDGKDVLSSNYQGYNRGYVRSEVSVSAGSSITVQAVQGCCSLKFDSGALTLARGADPIHAVFVLEAGQGFRTVSWPKGSGHPYYLISEAGSDSEKDSYGVWPLGSAIFQVRPGETERCDTPLVESVTLNRGESCILTDTSGRSDNKVYARGSMLSAGLREDGMWANPYTIAPMASVSSSFDKNARAYCFTALEDGCTLRYYPSLTEVSTDAQALYETVTIPRGESRIFSIESLDDEIFAYGFNPERSLFKAGRNEWETPRRGLSDFGGNTSGEPAIKVIATDSDATVIFLRGETQTGPVLAIDRTLRHGGEPVSPEDLGSTPVDSVSLTLLPENTEPFTLVLAAYDSEGALIRTALRPVAAGELSADQAATLDIPFSCGAGAAAIRLMTVDAHFCPLKEAVVLAE